MQTNAQPVVLIADDPAFIDSHREGEAFSVVSSPDSKGVLFVYPPQSGLRGARPRIQLWHVVDTKPQRRSWRERKAHQAYGTSGIDAFGLRYALNLDTDL
ncbi:MAG: hypothetical protein JWO99_409 [Candidatus Saccharibacteria bacterium]|nr:hypothetical protein [Candidatus Saccharibacteria bacterium]